MSSQVTLYAFEDADGAEDTYTTFDPIEAQDRARRYHLRVNALEYEYSDSQVVWDFTGAEKSTDA